MVKGSLTQHRRLRDGRPIWLVRGAPRLRTEPPESLPATADVVVVGSGITGAFIADALSSAGFRVLILDRRERPISGSTPASTALLQFEIDTPFVHLARKIGRRDAARAWRRSYRAVQDLGRRVRELRIDCSFRRREAIYLPGNVLDANGLEDELAARQSIGLPSHRLSRKGLVARLGIEKPCAIVSQGAAEVDPLQLAAGLLRRAIGRGARLLVPVEVSGIETCRGGAAVLIAGGRSVRARHVVLATGYETPDCVPMTGHKIISTWSLATRPQPAQLWKGRELIWEAADPYLYIRTTSDGRLLAGGEDEEVADADTRDGMTPQKIGRLERKLARLFPALDTTADHSWSGSFGESETGLPSVGPVPGLKACFAVLGYGGNGITFSMMAAQIIQRTVCGAGDPDADLFAFRNGS